MKKQEEVYKPWIDLKELVIEKKMFLQEREGDIR